MLPVSICQYHLVYDVYMRKIIKIEKILYINFFKKLRIGNKWPFFKFGVKELCPAGDLLSSLKGKECVRAPSLTRCLAHDHRMSLMTDYLFCKTTFRKMYKQHR